MHIAHVIRGDTRAARRRWMPEFTTGAREWQLMSALASPHYRRRVNTELVAGECAVLAETKDHLNWELIGHLAKSVGGKEADVLQQAFDAVEQDEDHHLYHSTGWTRELWLQSLGLPAVLALKALT